MVMMFDTIITKIANYLASLSPVEFLACAMVFIGVVVVLYVCDIIDF